MSITSAVVIDVDRIEGQLEVGEHRELDRYDDDSLVRRRRQKREQRNQRRNRRRSYAIAQSRDDENSPTSTAPRTNASDGEEAIEQQQQQCDVEMSSNGRRALLTVPGDDVHEGNDEDNVNEENVEGSGLPYPEYIERAFYFLNQTTAPRSWCLKLVTWQYPFRIQVYDSTR